MNFNLQFHAVNVLARMKFSAYFVRPSFFIFSSFTLAVTFFFLNCFVGSIDTSGFNYRLQPVFFLVGSVMAGAFGDEMVGIIFQDGPFLFVLYVYSFLFIIFISVNLIIDYSQDEKTGVMELISYGPVGSLSFISATYIKDMVVALISLFLLFVGTVLFSMVSNLYLSSRYLLSLMISFFVSAVIVSYGIFFVCVMERSGSAIIAHLGVLSFLIGMQFVSVSLSTGVVRTVAYIVYSIIRWISPFFYWSMFLRSFENGDLYMCVLSVFFLVILSLSVLLLSIFISHLKLLKK